MDSYKPYPGPGSSNQARSPGEVSNSSYFTPRLSSPAVAAANNSRRSSVSPLAASAERDPLLPYPTSYVSNTTHHKTQRPTTPRSPRQPRSPSMLPPQTTSQHRHSPSGSPAISRQPSQRTRTRSSTVTSDDGHSMFMSEFRKHSGTGTRPDMQSLYPDQVGHDQAIASDDDSLVIPGAMPKPDPIPRSDPTFRSEPMEKQSSSKRSSKIFSRGRNPSEESIAGDDDSESGFRAKVSKLLKNKDSKPDLISDILAEENEKGNAQIYEEHIKQQREQGASHMIDIGHQTAAFTQFYPPPFHPGVIMPQGPLPPAGTPLASQAYDEMIRQQEAACASDLDSEEPKKSRRKSMKKSRSSSPPQPDVGLGIDRMMLPDDMTDFQSALPAPTISKPHRSKSKSSRRSPGMSPNMLPTITQSKTVPYPSHHIRNASPPIEILELSSMERSSQDRRRKTKRSSRQSQIDVAKLLRHVYDSTPSLDVILRVIMQPVETARTSEYPNLAIVIAMVEVLIFIWLLYQAIIILEFACAVVRFICYPAVYILKAIASSFPSMEGL